MKLWNVKTSECVKSLEVSDDDDATVWALAVNAAEDHVITGTSNSTLVLWKVMFMFDCRPSGLQSESFLCSRLFNMYAVTNKKLIRR